MRSFASLCVCCVLLYGCGDDATNPAPPAPDLGADMSPELSADMPEADAAPDMTERPDLPLPPKPPIYINLTPTPRARGVTRAELTASLTAWEPATGQLTFSPGSSFAQSIKMGDVLAAEVSPLTPYGLLRAVERVEQRRGAIVVSTRQAFFPEAFTGDFYVEIDTTLLPTRPIGVDTGEVRVDVDRLNKELSFAIAETLVDQDGIPNTGDELTVSAEAGAGLRLGLGGDAGVDYDFPLDVDVYVSLEAGAGFNQSLRGALVTGISGPVDVSRKLQDHEFTPVTVWVGPVPIVIVPAIRPSIRVHGDSTPSTLQLDQSASFYAGVRYHSSSGWTSGIEGPTIMPPAFSMQLPGDHAQGELTGELVLRGEAMIYGIVGPYTDARIGLQNTVDKPSAKHWDIEAVFGVDVGLQLDLGVFGSFGYGKNVYMGAIPLQSAPLSNVPPRVDDLSAQQVLLSGGSPGAFIVGEGVIFTPKIYDEVGTGLTIRTYADDVLVNTQTSGAPMPFSHAFTAPGAHAMRVEVSSSVTNLSASRTFMLNAAYAPPQLYVFEPAASSDLFESIPVTIVVAATGNAPGGQTSGLSCATLTATGGAQDSFAPLPTPSWGQADRCYLRATFQGVGARSILIRAVDPLSGLTAQRVLPLNIVAKPAHVPPTISRVAPSSGNDYIPREELPPSTPNTTKHLFTAQLADSDDATITAQRWTVQRYCGVSQTPRSGASSGAPLIAIPLDDVAAPALIQRELDLGPSQACGTNQRTGWEVRYEARGVADAQRSSVSWWIIALPPIN